MAPPRRGHSEGLLGLVLNLVEEFLGAHDESFDVFLARISILTERFFKKLRNIQLTAANARPAGRPRESPVSGLTHPKSYRRKLNPR